MFNGVPVIDTWVNHNPPERAVGDWAAAEVSSLLRQFHGTASLMTEGTTDEQLVQRMDDAGVDFAFLSTNSFVRGFDDLMRACEEVAETCRRYPNRFAGTGRLEAVFREGTTATEVGRAVERMATDYGFVGVRISPSQIEITPDHPRCYAAYIKCVEHDIPIGIQVGHPGPMWRAEFQRIDPLDRICLDFPELRVVAAHMGYPWHDELLSFMIKHQNLFMMTSAWTPKYYPESVVRFMKSSRSRHKIMFATDFPILDFKRPLGELAGLELDAETTGLFLGGTAARVFKLEHILEAAGANNASEQGSAAVS